MLIAFIRGEKSKSHVSAIKRENPPKNKHNSDIIKVLGDAIGDTWGFNFRPKIVHIRLHSDSALPVVPSPELNANG